MRTLHEVVVRNRLEQLRKRQRDEALQAQEELLAGVAKSAQRGEGHAFEIRFRASEKLLRRGEVYSGFPRLLEFPEFRPEREVFDEALQTRLITTKTLGRGRKTTAERLYAGGGKG